MEMEARRRCIAPVSRPEPALLVLVAGDPGLSPAKLGTEAFLGPGATAKPRLRSRQHDFYAENLERKVHRWGT
jgi:hypothetical protein